MTTEPRVSEEAHQRIRERAETDLRAQLTEMGIPSGKIDRFMVEMARMLEERIKAFNEETREN